MIKKERLKNLTLTGYTKCKIDREKQRVTYTTTLYKRIGTGRDDEKRNLTRNYKDLKLWVSMFAHVMPGYGIKT